MLTQSERYLRSLQTNALLIALSFLAANLAGCGTFSTAAAPDISLACNTYQKGATYDSTRDTSETVRGVRVKNQSFSNIGCDLVNGGVK